LQHDDGTVFKVTPQGELTTLHSFHGLDGENPIGGTGQGTNGVFYGTTLYGGSDGLGTIFSISEGLGAFVQTAPGVGMVGQHILILGTDLTGATSVTFDGIPAPFNVVSPTLITAIVPTSATPGPVQVVTPGGTLSSIANFLVVP
jgi:uncharacterized repeat protein (TIGR03803 family)